MHYYVYARYTDVLLMFAEAANEAAGPEGEIGGYTAKGVINAIRAKGGYYDSVLCGPYNQPTEPLQS